MKISKIKKIIMNRKYMMIREDEWHKQWIGDGFAMYCIEGMPKMTQLQLLRFLDIPEEKHGDIQIDERFEFELADKLDDADLSVIVTQIDELNIKGHEYAALTDSGGATVFVDPEYLKPTEDPERRIVITEDGWVATYDGMFLNSIIGRLMPQDEVKLRVSEIYSALCKWQKAGE